MKVSSYKAKLCKLLNSVSSEYSLMTFSDKVFFEKCAVHCFTVIEPIIASDIEMLNKLASRVQLYID